MYGPRGPRGGEHDYSQGCTCEGKKHLPHRDRNWRVRHRNCNYSAFNGYKRTYSAYSEVMCRDCGRRWRTKAAYVDTLMDAGQGE